VSIAALRPAAVVFREEQHFAWWIYAALGFMAFFAFAAPAWVHPGAANAAAAQRWGLEIPVSLAVGLALPLVLIIGVLRMTTEVTPTDLRVWFGWIPTYRQFVPITSIEGLEVVSFRPIADYGFWGIRSGKDGERALIARGNRGVRLHLTDGTHLLIGSQRPEALAIAIEKAMLPPP
jgi:hypothetical protein